ncbi:MAG: division/cell wall cluster transcriptional repressor MraZ [Actinomycetota bacterium]|nr:division/cell wall cluster transcriptional repressor MraZ [Actinomycetota bacterium]
MSFTGEFRHTIDAKGRLIVPSRMRDELGEDVMLSRWLDDCIAIWSLEEWAAIEAKLRSQKSGSKAARRLVRRIAGSAHPDSVDKQGRITVPAHLRELAGITRDVLVVGALNRAELWNPNAYQQEQLEEGQLEELAEDLDF